MTSVWSDKEILICASVADIVDDEQGSANHFKKAKIMCPRAWQQHIAKVFEDARTDDSLLFRCSAYFRVMDCFSFDDQCTESITQSLRTMIADNIHTDMCSDQRTVFDFGAALEALIRFDPEWVAEDHLLWPHLCKISANLGRTPLFLENLLHLCEVSRPDLTNLDFDDLAQTLTQNLSCPHHSVRLLSLQLMSSLLTKNDQQPDVLKTAIAIENTTLTLQSARLASMHIRNMSSQYKSHSLDPWLSNAIPHFCFGLLNFKLSQVWEDAVEALKMMCETKEGEDIVSKLAFRWLADGFQRPDQTTSSSLTEDSPQQHLNQFECSELSRIRKLIDKRFQELDTAAEQLQKTHDARHESLNSFVPETASRALKVLIGVPYVAEKHSRSLVPLFLQWSSTEQRVEEITTADNISSDLDTSTLDETSKEGNLSRQDQKAMLDLFAHFINPRVLYKSSDVYDALLNLLSNGNVEIQKAALKAIFTWKIKSIQPYQENILNILDDARFREEIAVFLQADSDESTIQSTHRRELMPILLRLLYGKIIARSGTASGRREQTSKRKAVLEALSRFSEDDLREFVFIALGPLANLPLVGEYLGLGQSYPQCHITVRRQFGLVNMMGDMLETLGSQLKFLTQPITCAVLWCTIRSARKLYALTPESDTLQDATNEQNSLLRSIRQTGIRCLAILFQRCQREELNSYMNSIFEHLINPRIEKLPIETAQSISGLLRLFAVWATSPHMALYFSDYNTALLWTIIDCIDVASAKDEVKLFVIEEILKPLIALVNSTKVFELDVSGHGQLIQTRVLNPNIDRMLEQAGKLLRKSPGKDLLGSTISLVSQLAPLVTGKSQIRNLLEVSTFLLDQPSQRVSPKSKGDLLRTIQQFVPLADFSGCEALRQHLYTSVSSLFGYFKDRSNRVILSEVMITLSKDDHDLIEVAKFCLDLNAFSSRSIDEPDFDKRLKAFATLNESAYLTLSPKQWRPIVYNMLFYIKDDEELAIRTNASYALRRYIETNSFSSQAADTQSPDLLKQVLLPALRSGALERSEFVRAEYLAVMAHLVRKNCDWSEVSDMEVLLVNEDEEASIFSNILHIQQHRRLRALRRLATEARQGHLKSINIAHFLIPLIEHFIFDKADDDGAHNLAAEAVSTIGALSEWLEWPQLRAMFRRFSSYIQTKPDLEKTIVKLLGVTIESISTASAVRRKHQCLNSQNANDVLVEVINDNPSSTLSLTLPSQDKFADDLLNNLLPSLMSYLHDKDESTVSLRVPVAISVVKLLKTLPPSRLAERLPAVLTDVCHILRSRSQESRDLTRRTLVEISTLIGPSCFGFVLKELRSSLARGYQLHVLSYTVHSILVATASIFKPGDLDYCLSQIVAVIMDDIFGATGQEKDAEEYISKMKEVKSSKSYDSMELIAKTSSISYLLQLIRPLQTLLEEKLDLRMVKKIEELLRRIGIGLLRNDAAQSRQTLIFCFELIQDVYKKDGHVGEKTSKEDYRVKRFLILSKSKNSGRGSSSSYRYKLTRFALDIVRSILQKYNDMLTTSNMSGFVPILENALCQAQEEVQISALRLLATIIKVPLNRIDDKTSSYASEAVKMIKNAISTNSEISQAALKLISAVLRERRSMDVKENDISYLLKRLKPDLEEPDRQGVTFNFLKAIIARKIIIPEVYEVLDTVATMMVTNQTKGARDVARGVYFQFILNYPQSKDRLGKQLGFLVRNLEYKYIEGRQSVMEAMHLLLSKVCDNLLQDLVGTFFVPLIMVITNDESAECRSMAGELLKELFEKADSERIQNVSVMLQKWLNQDEQKILVRVALQVYSIHMDSQSMKRDKNVSLLQERINYLLKKGIEDESSADWELQFYSLQTIMKMYPAFPDLLFQKSSASLWTNIRKCLYFPHAWVKLVAAKLIGVYFADFARANAHKEEPKKLDEPLIGSLGLELTNDEMIQTIRSSLRCLRIGVGEELVTQSARNLVFIGRFAGTLIMPQLPKIEAPEQDDTGEDTESSEDNVFDPEPMKGSDKIVLQYIFERLSAILRREPINTRPPALVPKTAALQIIATLCNHIAEPTLVSLTETILLPLHNLTDPSIPAPYSTDEGFQTAHKALVSTSQEIMTLLQKKLGTTEYIARLTRVREGVKERREGRRVKRRLEAVAEPEKVGRDKRRKGEKKKEKRKERSGEERGRRRGW